MPFAMFYTDREEFIVWLELCITRVSLNPNLQSENTNKNIKRDNPVRNYNFWLSVFS